MSSPYTPQSWYWFVGADRTKAYFSAVGDYVAVTDATYLAWLANGNTPTQIDTEANLGAVLIGSVAPRPINANVLDGYTTALASAVDRVIFQILFNHENRIRTLAGQAQVTVQQFRTGVKALL